MQISHETASQLKMVAAKIEGMTMDAIAMKYMVRVKGRIDLVLGKKQEDGKWKIIEQLDTDLKDVHLFNGEGGAKKVVRSSPYRKELEVIRVKFFLLQKVIGYNSLAAYMEKQLQEKRLAESSK